MPAYFQIQISKLKIAGIFILVIVLFSHFYSRKILKESEELLSDLRELITTPVVNIEDYIRGMIPKMDYISNCDDLFKNTTYSEFFKDTGYLEKRIDFDKRLNDVLGEVKSRVEGHTGLSNFERQTMAYYLLARLPFVKTICETGFNAGHSTLLWLSANPKVNVISFDLGSHSYTRKMASYLKDKFPGRLELILGSSVETVPNFSKSEVRKGLDCDILIVDGGHSQMVAFKDLLNMKELANPHGNILIFDDYPNLKPLVAAWNDAKKQIALKNYMTCTMPYARRRKGFLIGGYI